MWGFIGWIRTQDGRHPGQTANDRARCLASSRTRPNTGPRPPAKPRLAKPRHSSTPFGQPGRMRKRPRPRHAATPHPGALPPPQRRVKARKGRQHTPSSKPPVTQTGPQPASRKGSARVGGRGSSRLSSSSRCGFPSSDGSRACCPRPAPLSRKPPKSNPR